MAQKDSLRGYFEPGRFITQIITLYIICAGNVRRIFMLIFVWEYTECYEIDRFRTLLQRKLKLNVNSALFEHDIMLMSY